MALCLKASAVVSPVRGGLTDRTMPDLQSEPTEEKNLSGIALKAISQTSKTKLYQRGSVSFMSKLKLAPVPALIDPVDCTPVSKPPALGVHGASNVDSGRYFRRQQGQVHQNMLTNGTVLYRRRVLEVFGERKCEGDCVSGWPMSGMILRRKQHAHGMAESRRGHIQCPDVQ